MRYSVIIATLGRPTVLKRTIDSVARCDPAPDELVVVDGAEDGSSEPAVAGEWPFEVRYFTAARGLPKQRNAGIDAADGDVLVFVDDDVEVPKNTFAVLDRVFADAAVAGATALIVEPAVSRIGKKHSPVRRLLPGGGAEGTFTRYGYPRRLIDLESERDIAFMHGSFMSVRADVARAVRFDERLPGYALAEDEDFSYRVSRRGRIRFVPELRVLHAKEGHGSRDARAFGRTVVINRAYLFRKNFRTSPLARVQFALLIVLFMAHRLVNREWSEFVGLVEGAVRARSRPLERDVEIVPRIVFVSSHARAGGSETYLRNLLADLDARTVAAVVCLEHGPLVDGLARDGFDVRVVPVPARPLGIVRASGRFRRVLRRIDADVVHANGVKAALLCALARVRLPVVWVKHDFSLDGVVTRFAAARSAVVVGVSRACLASLSERQQARAEVVYTGVDLPEVDRDEAGATLRAEIGAAPDDVLVGFVGRLHPVKGHLDFVDAAGRVVVERERARFVIVGGDDPSVPEHAGRVRTAAARLGARIHLLGHRSDIGRVIAGFDIGVMASNRAGRPDVEALPLTALEMLASGTPLVAYASGGIPELAGDCAVLVATGDVDALSAAIVRLIDHAEDRRTLSECGRQRVVENFPPGATARRMREIYARAAR